MTTERTLAGPQSREGFTTVTPYIWVPDRGLADFLMRVFDAVETSVTDNPAMASIARCVSVTRC